MPLTEQERSRVGVFHRDLAQGIRAVLNGLGCTLEADLPPWDVCLAYANYKFRRIPVAVRQVHWSDTLMQQADLTGEKLAAIKAIEAKSLAGDDLYPHQSTSLLDPLSRDGLQADWHIHHLHLGLAAGRAPPFLIRTHKVLLVRITSADVYFIAALAHGPGVEPPWWNIDLPETLHRNWPESIAHLVAGEDGPDFTSDDHHRLRPRKPQERGCTFTTFVTVKDGTAYLFGSGLATTGYSASAVMFANDLMNHVRDVAAAKPDAYGLTVEGDHRHLKLKVVQRSAPRASTAPAG